MEGLTPEELGHKTKSHLCLFCYKNARGFSFTDDSAKRNENAKSWKYFLKIIQRMKGHNTNEHSLVIFGDIGCCEDCLVIIREFTGIYHKVKCLELQLLWKLDKLMKIMKLATRVPSRVNQIKQSFTELYPDLELAENKMRSFKSSRNKLMKTCTWKLFTSQPRVILRRIPDSNQIGDSNFLAKTEQTINLFPHQPEVFLGWTMSFAAVAMLASLSHGMGEEHLKILNTQHHQICDDEYDLTVETENIVENVCFSDAEDNDVEDVHTLISSKEPNPELQSLSNFIAKTELITDQPNDEDTSRFCNIPSPQSTSSNSDSSHSEDMMLNVSDQDQEDEEESHAEQKPVISEEPDNKPLLQEPAWVVCTICQRKFKSDKYLQKHLQTVHTVYTLSPYICSICNLTYTKIDLLRHHYKRSKSHQILWNIARKKQLSNVASSSRDADECIEEMVTSTNSEEPQSLPKITTITNDSIEQPMDEESSSFCNVPSPQTSLYYSESSHSDEDDEGSHTEQKSEKTYTKSQLQNPAAPQYTCRICNLTYAYNYLLQRHYKRSKRHQVLWKRAQKKQISNVRNESPTKLTQNENQNEENNIHSTNKTDENVTDSSESISQKIDHGEQTKQTEDTNTAQKSYYLRKRKAANFLEKDEQDGSEKDARSDSEYEPDEEEMQIVEKKEQMLKKVKPSNADSKVKWETCNICKRTIIGDRMANHMKTHHYLKGFDPSKIRKCKFKDCTAYFKTSRQCQRHSLQVHGRTHKPRSKLKVKLEATIQCKYCSKNFCRSQALYHHIKKWHANLLVCSVSKCSKRFSTLALLKRHEKLHGSWKCQFCDVTKDYVPDLACHEVQHAHRENPSTKTFSCARCTQDFTQKPEYERHFVRHHLKLFITATGSSVGASKNWWCDLEPCIRRGFSTFAKFQEHQKLHAPGRYTCNFCNCIQDNMIKLSMHELEIHGQNKKSKNFSCPRCPWETSFVLIYQQHFAQVHLQGYDPTVCNSEALREDKCLICNQTMTKLRMNLHHKTCHDLEGFDPQKVLKCDIQGCSAYFKKKQQVLAHKQNVHKFKSAKQIAAELTEEERKEKEAIVETTDGKRLFECKVCKKRFHQHFHFRLHVSKVHRENPLLHKCPVSECKLKFATAQLLEQHQKLHGNWKCQFCDETKNYAPDLAFHEVQHAYRTTRNKDGTKLWCCARCNQNNKSKGRYEKHFLTHHLKLLNTSPCCPICGADGLTNTKAHQKAFHDVDGMAPENIARCDLCPAYFKTYIQLEQHKCIQHWERKCPACGKEFFQGIRLRLFRLHIQKHHADLMPHWKFACSNGRCTQRYATQKELANHESRCEYGNQVQEEFPCPTCGKAYKRKLRLWLHMKNAHGEKCQQCQTCGKAFRTKAALQNHLEFHKSPDQWKFACNLCGRRFAHKGILNQHKNTHTQEKPYVCEYCGEKYAHKHNWRNHVKTKHADQADNQS